MRATVRGLVVLALSAVLGAALWFGADTVGNPTPMVMEPGLHQPAFIGAQRTVTYLVAGTVLWVAWAAFARLVGIGRKRPRARV